MSLLRRYGLIGGSRLTPNILNTNVAGLASGTYTITPSVAPTAGNLLLFLMGGSQTRAITSFPAGVTEITITFSGSGQGSHKAFYKVATGSEPASYDFVWGASLSGGWRYLEIINFDETDIFEPAVGNGGLALTTVSPDASYDILVPSITFATLNLVTGSDWTIDNGYVDLGGANNFQTARKRFNAPALGETVNWSGSASDLNSALITINGKKI